MKLKRIEHKIDFTLHIYTRKIQNLINNNLSGHIPSYILDKFNILYEISFVLTNILSLRIGTGKANRLYIMKNV